MLPVSSARAANSGTPSGSKLFVESSLDNAAPWVGQEVRLTYTLFFSGAAPQIEDKSQPEHPGIWVRELAPETYIDSTPVSKNGELFRKAVVKQLRLVPMQSGKLPVTGYRIRCLVPRQGEASLDSRNDTETIVIAQPAIIQARALPKPAPADFSGAVGHFTLSVSPENSTVHAGESLSLSVTISGKGNLDTPPPLKVLLPEGIRQEASATPPDTASAKGSTSSVSTKMLLIASKEGVFRFVPVKLTAFDPEAGRYETIASNAIAIKVIAGQATSAQPQSPLSGVMPPMADPDPLDAVISPIIMSMGIAVLALIFGLHLRYIKRYKRTEVQQKRVKRRNHPDRQRRLRPPLRRALVANPRNRSGTSCTALSKKTES
ncbi:BatD family protein [Chlorobaculum sp. MV4-Y]|uniref:BatD family protein n=1 Tax=Chlorobaculum sp. MV4-Y TaxID=2976335 RepID=UPI0021B02831|nr:BatD family protein [Chlorobaculum sp. MV4-Y]UWX57708.1 BatD family protein [Chlorobaculum sp. MV4-Y]